MPNTEKQCPHCSEERNIEVITRDLKTGKALVMLCIVCSKTWEPNA